MDILHLRNLYPAIPHAGHMHRAMAGCALSLYAVGLVVAVARTSLSAIQMVWNDTPLQMASGRKPLFCTQSIAKLSFLLLISGRYQVNIY